MMAEVQHGPDSQGVNAHLGIIQSVIQRMASNSASAKAWCITLVSAVLVVLADKNKADYVWIAVIPIVLFLVLDAYYLALEKGFRNSYNKFIDKMHGGEVESRDLYAVIPSGSLFKLFFKSLRSFSVGPFYVTLLAMVYLAWKLVL
ncbi:MAG: hypothetical protein ABIH23_22560 [bacterium]